MIYTRQELEATGLTDFRVFLRQVWDFLLLPPPTPVQNDIAHWLQHGERRVILSAFRGVGKSWITVAYVLWLLLLDPQLKIMVVSASQPLADDFAKFAKQLIHGMPLLHPLAPRDGQRDSAIRFDVGPARESRDPSVKTVGITGQITGSRADVIIADDIEVPKNSQTHLLRERLAELVKEFDSVVKPGGRIIYLGTPQVEDSLYNRLLNRGYTMRVWPSEIPEKPENYGGRLAPFVVRRIEAGWPAGTPIDPDRFSRDDLLERKASYGISGYALQFLLDTSPSEAEKHPLKLKDLIVTDVDMELAPVRLVWGSDRDAVIQDLPSGGFDGDTYVRPVWRSPDMAPFQGTVMAIDPSGKGKDETAYAIVRYSHGLLYLVDVGGFVDGFGEDTLYSIALKTKEFRVNDIIIETNYGGGMFNKLLESHLVKHGSGRIDYDWRGWSTGTKEMRICDTLEPVTRNHRLVVDRRVIEEDLKVQENSPHYSFVWQYTRMQRLRGALPHDDRVEAVAMAVGYWTDRMNRDQERALDLHRKRKVQEELKRFRKHVFRARGGGRGRDPLLGV